MVNRDDYENLWPNFFSLSSFLSLFEIEREKRKKEKGIKKERKERKRWSIHPHRNLLYSFFIPIRMIWFIRIVMTGIRIRIRKQWCHNVIISEREGRERMREREKERKREKVDESPQIFCTRSISFDSYCNIFYWVCHFTNIPISFSFLLSFSFFFSLFPVLSFSLSWKKGDRDTWSGKSKSLV